MPGGVLACAVADVLMHGLGSSRGSWLCGKICSAPTRIHSKRTSVAKPRCGLEGQRLDLLLLSSPGKEEAGGERAPDGGAQHTSLTAQGLAQCLAHKGPSGDSVSHQTDTPPPDLGGLTCDWGPGEVFTW